MSKELADEREEYADSLTDMDIWRQVVRNVVKMEAEIDTKVEILIGAIPDIAVIYSQLRFNNRIGDLPNKEYHDILDGCLTRLKLRQGDIEFNPLLIEGEDLGNKTIDPLE